MIKKMIYGVLLTAALAITGVMAGVMKTTERDLSEVQLENLDALTNSGEGFVMICGATQGTCWIYSYYEKRCIFSGWLKDYCVNM